MMATVRFLKLVRPLVYFCYCAAEGNHVLFVQIGMPGNVLLTLEEAEERTISGTGVRSGRGIG